MRPVLSHLLSARRRWRLAERSSWLTPAYHGEDRPAGTLRRVAEACLSSRERSSSFSCRAVSSGWVWTMAATSLFKAFLLMALMFRSSRKTSCLCGLATLRRHTTGRWSEESARATRQEGTSWSLSLYSTQSMMCPQRWVGFRTPWTMSNVVMICRAFEVSGLEGESKCMLKSPSMISFPRRVLQYSKKSGNSERKTASVSLFFLLGGGL